MGRPAAYPTLPIAHALHDDDVDGEVVTTVHDGLLVELATKPELALPLGCR